MESITIYSRQKLARADLSFIMEQILTIMGADTRNCKVTYLACLIRRARELMCPHTKDRSFCPEWDRLFAYGLVYCVSQCILSQAWERQIKVIIIHDLEQSVPYDGSVGHVVHLIQVMNHVLDAVISNNKKSMMQLLQRSKLRLPVLNIFDEFGWNLLHHAAYHSATEVMKALVFEGISPLEISRERQTPVHVAAAALRYGALTTFFSLGTLSSSTVLTLADSHGRTPLHCLLHTLSVGAWHRHLSSQQLLDVIKMLLVQHIDLWHCIGEEDTSSSELNISTQKMTAFASIVLHADAYVAEGIIQCAHAALYAEAIESSDSSGSGELTLLTSKPAVIFELKRVILLIIRRKKSRVLTCLLTTFGELLFEDIAPFPSPELRIQELVKADKSSNMLSVSSQQSVVSFLHQCLYAAAASSSLRIMSMLLKFGALICPSGQQNSQGAFQKSTKEMYHKIITEHAFGVLPVSEETGDSPHHTKALPFASYSSMTAFLLLPVLRGDSSMLRLILDHLEHDPVTLLWLSSPCAYATWSLSAATTPILEDCSFSILSRGTTLFQAWCAEGRLRQSKQLVDLAHIILSPLATACLRNDPYLLKLMLDKHWCSRNTSVAQNNESGQSPPLLHTKNYLYRGLNPLICCVFSGSVACMTLLLEHFGPTHFGNMCNCRDDLNLLPLFALLLLLRVKLKQRLFVSSGKLSTHYESESFVTNVMRYYSLLSPSHTAIMEMLGIMLPHTQFKEGQHWQEEEIVQQNAEMLQLKIEKFQELQKRLQSHVNNSDEDGTEYSSDVIHKLIATSQQQWEYVQWCVGTDAFVNSLRALGTVVCKKPDRRRSITNLSANIDEIRMNRQFQNITRAVVLLLKGKNDDFLPNFQTNWWEELDLLINNDFDRKTCKLARAMIAMRNRNVMDDTVLSRVKGYVDQTERWLKQGNALLPPRKANCYFVHNCFVALDLLHKWSSLIVKENVQRGIFHPEKETLLLKGDLTAVECVLKSLNSYRQSSSSSPFMALLGEEVSPLGFDMAICAAGAVLQDHHDVLSVSVSAPDSVSQPAGPLAAAATQVPATSSVDDSENINTHNIGDRLVEVDGRRVSKQPITRCLDNITDICDDVLTALMEDATISLVYSQGDGRPFSSVPDLCGLTPLLGMCTNDLWVSAERAMKFDEHKGHLHDTHAHHMTQSNHDHSEVGHSVATSPTRTPSCVFFPGGLKDYVSVTDSRLSSRLGGELRQLLREWSVDAIPLESECGRRNQVMLADDKNSGRGGLRSIQVVDVLDLAILKRKTSFCVYLLAQPLFATRRTHELMILAYVTNNIPLCLDLALECESELYNNNSISYLKYPSYFASISIPTRSLATDDSSDGDDDAEANYSSSLCSMRRFCNNIYDFSVGYNVKHNLSESEDFFISKFQGYASPERPLPIAQCAARLLIDLSHQTRRECQALHVGYSTQVQKLMHRSTSVLQMHQQRALDLHGFRPMYKGPFAGLCFSNDGRVWVMDGSLMNSSDFFSNVANLSKALPVPQTNHQSISSSTTSIQSGHTVVHSIVNRAHNMSPEILEFIFKRLSCVVGQESTAKSKVLSKQLFLTTDIKKRSPVFLAISRGNINLANTMLLSSSSVDTINSPEDAQQGAVSIPNDGLCYHFLKTSADMVSSLESELGDRLQGSYRKNNVSGALMHLLMVHLDRVEMLWDYLQHKCEISTLSRLIYDPSGQVIDCFQRAKAILLLLNIPFSQLHNKLVERKDATSDAAETEGEEVIPLERRYKNLSPDAIKKLVPWKTAMACKSIVQGWVQLRARRDKTEGGAAAAGTSLQSIYASKIKQVMKQQPNCYPSVTKEHLMEYPFKQALVQIESSVLLYHSVDLSLVTYGFASVCRTSGTNDERGGHDQDTPGSVREGDHRSIGGRETIWNSPFPPLLLAETRHLREREGKQQNASEGNSVRHMAQLLTMYKKNAVSMQRAMQCAYAILEFARTLSTTRILVTLTQEVPSCVNHTAARIRIPSSVPKKSGAGPNSTTIDGSTPSPTVPCLRKPSGLNSQSSTRHTEPADTMTSPESVRHPVDAIRHAIIFARDNFNATKAFISSLVESTSSAETSNTNGVMDECETSEAKLIQKANRVVDSEYLSHGAGSRLRIADDLGATDMAGFLTLKTEISPMFTNLRHILMESLLILMEVNPGTSVNDRSVSNLDSRVITQMEQFLSRNSVYDERVLLEGLEEDNSNTAPLSQRECELLSEQLLTFIQNLSIKNITGVKLDLMPSTTTNDTQSASNSSAPTFTPVLPSDVIERLFKHVLSHPTIFCHNASIPTRGKHHHSYSREYAHEPKEDTSSTFVPLAHCPSVAEQADLLNLVGYSTGDRFGMKQANTENNVNASNTAAETVEKNVAEQTGSTLKEYLRVLNCSYRLSETIIELILTVIGLHSMSHVYLLDFQNSSGGLKCSPYISLCYSPSPSRSINQQLQQTHINDTVQCFHLLQTCGIDLHYTYDTSSSYFTDHAGITFSHMFPEYSELQYCVFCAALFGKTQLLDQLIAMENQYCQAAVNVKQRQMSCIIWYVLLACPPPANNYSDHDASGHYQGYSQIVLQLLKSGYGTSSPDGAQLSVLDLAALKQLTDVVTAVLQVYKKTDSWQELSLHHLGAFQFIALSKKFDAFTMQMLLSMQDFDHEKALTDIVCLDHFIPACINDSKIFANMFSFITSHIDTYKNLTRDTKCTAVPATQERSGHNVKIASLGDVLKRDGDGNQATEWSMDVSVHLLSSSLLGIFYSFNNCQEDTSNRTPHCPLFDIVKDLTSEVESMHDFKKHNELTTITKSLSWTNFHFVLCGKRVSKFQTFFTHFFDLDVSDARGVRGQPLSASGRSSLLPLLGLTGTRIGQAPCDLLHYVCFYSMGESLQILIDALGGRGKEMNFNGSLFFAPLNNSMTPIDVALAVGSYACVSTLLTQAKIDLSFHEINSISWKMLYASLGKGLGGEVMSVLLLRFIISVYSKYRHAGELAQAVNTPIGNHMPQSGVVPHETLLHLAARRGFVQLCSLLLETGANVSTVCALSGQSVLSTSITSGHSVLTQMLASYFAEENRAVVKITVMYRLWVLTRHRTKKF